MKLDIVEIGTADFWTSAGEVNGLFIEPIKDRFDALPDCKKENIAISNYNGEIEIFYIPKQVIIENEIPPLMAGCSSVNEPHPSVIKHGFQEFVISETVKVERIKNVLDRHDVTDIHFLKIDTEGHDCIILNDFLDTSDIKPKVIKFEANILTPYETIFKTIKRLELIGYICEIQGEDCLCYLK